MPKQISAVVVVDQATVMCMQKLIPIWMTNWNSCTIAVLDP